MLYLLYFDEARGHTPLLIYPSEQLIDDKRFMRPIKYHSIWFLSVEEQDLLDHIDLEYKGYTFMAKKFFAKSTRIKKRAGLEKETPETIVIILSMPTDLEIFGDELIQTITKEIIEQFDDKFSDLILGQNAKEEIIKTPKIKEQIRKSEEIKHEMKTLIKRIGNNYFSKVITQADGSSIKKQKAISYLYLKGIDFSHIDLSEGLGSFSNVKLFDPKTDSQTMLDVKRPFNITDIHLVKDSQEIEIMVRKNNDKQYDNLTVKITHVKEFFEKEIMNQTIDDWFIDEELLFISPIIPHINDYLFFIIEGKNKEKLLSKKIDISLLN